VLTTSNVLKEPAMPTTYRTPDVYIEEISVFPPSVAEVETAIPAFIGYTEKARKTADNDLLLKPTKIYSFTEFEQYFGLAKDETIPVAATSIVEEGITTGVTVAVTSPPLSFLLYFAVKMFFDNGGGKCYIVSVGDYAATLGLTGLKSGLDVLALEDEPTLLVVPDAVKLTATEFGSLAQAMLAQCNLLKDRFAILDVHGGGDLDGLDDDELEDNRELFGANHLKYGAAYYPFLRTSLNHYVLSDETNVDVNLDGAALSADLSTFRTTNTAAYNAVKAALREHYLVLPPSAAVAGVYASIDSARGVWKAPANVGLADVIEPVVRLDNAHQEELNVDATGGKSINAIRAFSGKGTLVWGARTLAGNDNEWRYISVRRFFNMVEESVKKSTYWAVFEPNDANTWVKVRGMIENFLTQKWREGALAGATTREAYFVRCGLGVTMNAQDILEGRMNVEIGMAVVRPAEFIILKFSHKLQTS
jgi:Bacteriophage tail sheath protein